MKMFRVTFAAILGAAAVAATVEQPSGDVAPTESPLAVAERARFIAMERANGTLHAVMRTEQESRHNAQNEDLVDQEVTSIETAVPNTTQHYLRQREQLMNEHQHARKQTVREAVHTAQSAADGFKQDARALETQRRHAGLHESVYEGGYQHDEDLSEGWHDEAQDLGDATENHIEAFFDGVEGKLEAHANQLRIEQREQREQDERNAEHARHQNNSGNAILSAVALPELAPAASTAAPTESPLAVAERARFIAMERANGTLHAVMRTEQESRHNAQNEDLVDQEVASIETAVPNTTQHYLRQREQLMNEHQHARKQTVREAVHTAQSAADGFKQAASALETQRRHAGLDESVYEGGYQRDEDLSEGWHDEAQDLGDATENHIEAFFDGVEGKLEAHAALLHQEQRAQEERNEEDERGEDHSNHDSRQDQDEDQRDDQRGENQDERQEAPAAAAAAAVTEAPAVAPTEEEPAVAVVAVTTTHTTTWWLFPIAAAEVAPESPFRQASPMFLMFALLAGAAVFAVSIGSRQRHVRVSREPLVHTEYTVVP